MERFQRFSKFHRITKSNNLNIIHILSIMPNKIVVDFFRMNCEILSKEANQKNTYENDD